MKHGPKYYSRPRLEMLPFVPTTVQRLLDVGCGTGEFAVEVKRRYGCETWGIERHQESAEKACTKLDRVIVTDATECSIDIPERYFDCIICNDILEHLVTPEKLLLKLNNLLTLEGSLVCSLPNVRYLPVMKELLLEKEWRYREEGVLDYSHLRFFTENSIRRMLTDAGFYITRFSGINDAPPTWKQRLLLSLTGNLLKDTLFPQYACVAVPSGKYV